MLCNLKIGLNSEQVEAILGANPGERLKALPELNPPGVKKHDITGSNTTCKPTGRSSIYLLARACGDGQQKPGLEPGLAGQPIAPWRQRVLVIDKSQSRSTV